MQTIVSKPRTSPHSNILEEAMGILHWGVYGVGVIRSKTKAFIFCRNIIFFKRNMYIVDMRFQRVHLSKTSPTSASNVGGSHGESGIWGRGILLIAGMSKSKRKWKDKIPSQ